jgi:rhamnogalacturonyl hydrolase YesR
MDRRSFLAAALASGAATQFSTVTPQAGDHESRHRISGAKSAALAMQRRDWEQGILAHAFMEAGLTEDVVLLTRAAMVQQTPDGRMGVVISGGPTDPAMGGSAYEYAARYTSDPEMSRAVAALLDWIRHKAPRNAEGILYHVFDKPEMWSDGFNGAPPFLAFMGFYDEALHQIDGFRARLWDEKAHLLHHIWDDGKQQFTDPAFWGGGNGWAAAGLARVIRSLPRERRADRARLAEFARSLIDGCFAHQRADGLFHNVIDQPSTFVETNLAQMLAYAIYSGIVEGWLPATYRDRVATMRAAAYAKMDKNGFIQGACSAPNFDRPGISTEAQAFFILMESAAARAGSTHPRS